MRLYVKFFCILAIACVIQRFLPDLISAAEETAYELRVAYIWYFGTSGDFDRLIEDTRRECALRSGTYDLYELGVAYEQLLRERLGAASHGHALTDDEKSA